ncbi:beta-ketoacyl-[acyl-carrier-protein] synthase III A, chloroplastic [Daucus carota subsp. sativus]|uniref:beta-ketoacyl-[acyl-carrier-protein] synthase III A, chloroplastic n=1 Tax=Daucus carota subsp. sativus TaxID=79200 RepID=UPI003083EAB2
MPLGSWDLNPVNGNGNKKFTEAIGMRFVSKGCKLVRCGSVVPSLKVSKDDLTKLVETIDEWICPRTGIRNRQVILG